MHLLTRTVDGDPLWMWAAAVLATAALYAALTWLRNGLGRRLASWSGRTRTQIDDLITTAIQQTRWYFVLAIALYAAAGMLRLPGAQLHVVGQVVVLTLLAQAAVWGSGAISFGLRLYVGAQNHDPTSVTTINALALIGKILLWSGALLMALANAGVNVNALIAGLGVSSIAVALALQNILGDVFASISIVLDKPFVVGDFIVVDTFSGTVEYVGLKSTRIRALDGELLVFSNTDLLKSRIRNYQHMHERRIVFALGVTYETPYDKLEKLAGIIREIIESMPNARFNRAHFKDFGAYSLDFEVVYYVTSPDYLIYMDTQQAINLALFRRFADQGVAFAYPTQTLYTATEAAAVAQADPLPLPPGPPARAPAPAPAPAPETGGQAGA